MEQNFSLAKVPQEELELRVKRLQKYLEKEGIDGALLTHNVEIYYFSGTIQNAYLYIPKNGEPALFVKKSIVRAKDETPWNVEELNIKQFAERINRLYGQIKRLGSELDVLPYNLAMRLQKLFPNVEFVDIGTISREIRAVKTDFELKLLKESAKLTNDVIVELLPRILRVGMRDIDLAAEIEKYLRIHGNIGIMRTRTYNSELILGMVASGFAASIPAYFDGPAGGLGLTTASPQGAGWKTIARNEPIIVDIACAYEGYIIDQTRIAVIGELDADLEEAYNLSRKIAKKTAELAKPGVTWASLYQNALTMAETAGLSAHFMGYGIDQAKFLGHGVGLELDELPILANGFNKPLEEGMVIAVEPKFTFPGRGVVGIENTYVVGKSGLEILSYAPEEIIKL